LTLEKDLNQLKEMINTKYWTRLQKLESEAKVGIQAVKKRVNQVSKEV